VNPNLRKWLLNGFLFVATFATTTMALGPVYAVCIMSILLAHELGHYFTCKRYGVPATFPMFIPFPNILGTMGAVIGMKGPVPNRKALFDIGVSGPLTGMALAIPAVIVGVFLSKVGPKPDAGMTLTLGEPILFHWISLWLKGPLAPDSDIMLHPIGFAGWAALFVTSINLFPAGQLDGGHMMHSLFGQKIAKWIGWGVVALLGYLGFAYHPMWYFFGMIILLFTMRTPKPLEDETPVSTSRKLVALGTYILMALCFTPIPFNFSMSTH
jgi:membrane-associated protease RseP (regulator of RpoE activity)